MGVEGDAIDYFHSPLADVSYLARFLCPEDEVTDESIPWNWDSLFTSVSTELKEEWAMEEEAAILATTNSHPSNGL